MANTPVTNKAQNQGVWIGAGFGSEDVTAPFLAAQVGQVVIKSGKAYQFVQFKSTSSVIANGTPVMWQDYANFIVSAKVSDAKRDQIAGVALGSQTVGNYGWIQVEGPHSAVLDDGNSAQAGTIVFMSATDGTCANDAAGTAPKYVPLGVCTTNTSAGAFAATLHPPHNGW